MEPPAFPTLFLEHCPKVLEATSWMRIFKIVGTKYEVEATSFAECAFHTSGAGLRCESCDLHLTRPYCGHKLDEDFLPLIEEYYDQVAKYVKWEAQQQNTNLALGAGI